MSIHSKETMFNSELNDIKHHISPTSPTSITWSSESFISSEPSSPSLNSAGKYSIPIRLASTDRSQVPPSSQVKYSINHGHEFDYVEYCMRIEQETRESRGSVSYTDYYSNEDGQIRRSVNDNCLPLFVKPVYCATSSTEHSCRNKGDVNHDFSGDHITTCINEIKDEGNHDAYNNKDRTLIFEQSEDTRHDVQYAFKQPNNKSSINYKRIGRFCVQSMDIADSDVRIRETSRFDSSLFLKAQSTVNLSTTSAVKKANSLLRSQSVYMPKIAKNNNNSNMDTILKEKL